MQYLRQVAPICHRTVCHFARNKPNAADRLQGEKISDRSELMAIRLQQIHHKLRKCIEKQNPWGCQSLFDKLFWENTGEAEQVLAMYPMKNSVDYFLRDYPTLIMDLENQLHFYNKVHRSPNKAKLMQLTPEQPQQLIEENRGIRKMLVLLLWNKNKLQYLLKDPMTPNAFLLSGYVKAVCHLAAGEPRKAYQYLLSILNNRFLEQDPQMRVLIRHPKHKSLNLKQQALWNMLIHRMYMPTSAVRQGRALDLFNKIKEQQTLTADDFILEDYENFLNIWFSYRFDEPLEWQDVTHEQLQPLYKFIYLLAETRYLAQQKWQAKKILQSLPQKYPHRVFLEMSSLYDAGEHDKMHQVASRLLSDKHCKYMKDPQFDQVLHNILKLLRKITKNEEQAMAMQQKMYVVSATLNLDSKHKQRQNTIPAHYLILPFKQYLVHRKLNWLFEDSPSQ